MTQLFPCILTLLAIYGSVGRSLPAQEVFVQHREVFFRTTSGQLVQLTSDGKPKHHVRFNPASNRVVFYTDPVPFNGAPKLTFTVIDIRDGTNPKIVEIDGSSFLEQLYQQNVQSIESVEWLSGELFGVLGVEPYKNSYYGIFDVDRRSMVRTVVGTHLRLAPDRGKMVLRDAVPRGYILPEFRSNYVKLADLATKEKYPKLLYPIRDPNAPFDDLDQRHKILSDFYWSAASSAVAFVEFNQQAYWLVLLELETGSGVTQVPEVRRFKLDTEVRKIVDIDDFFWETVQEIEWSKRDNQVLVRGQKRQWMIDLPTGNVAILDEHR
jgi:hypothetical protein